jgi:RNA recognition motif-containing protein
MNIFISNLTVAITDGDLHEVFSEYGEISSAKVIMDRETRQSRGFGFVEMPDHAAAKKAIAELDRAEYDGKIIKVAEARPKGGQSLRSGGFNAGGQHRRF